MGVLRRIFNVLTMKQKFWCPRHKGYIPIEDVLRMDSTLFCRFDGGLIEVSFDKD